MSRTTIGKSYHRRGLIVATSSAIAAAFVLSACTAPVNTATLAQSGLASDTSLDADWQKKTYSSFYSQNISWRPCTQDDGLTPEALEGAKKNGIDESRVECARVEAPMNWADPEDKRTTELAVMRIRSTGDKESKPLFINPGGPGLTASSLAFNLVKEPSFNGVLDAYDVYGVDPRGVGASSPLSCKSSSTIPVVRLNECIEKNPLTHYMGTSQVARDMEMMRNLTGSDRFHYLGFSYGTVLGATYATLFPEKAGRMVLDSALTAKWASLTTTFEQQASVATEINEMVASCTEATCPFTNEDGVLALRDELTANPLKGSDGAEMSGAPMFQFLVDTLYKTPKERAERLALLKRAKDGDQTAIDELLVVAGLSSPPGEQPAADTAESAQPGPLFDATGEVINCHSFPKVPDITSMIETAKKNGVSRYFDGPEVNDATLRDYTELRCSVLAEAGDEFTESFHAPTTETPILVVGTTGDHATPYKYSQELVEQLGNATLLTFKAHGHGLSFAGRSGCLDKKVTDYLVNGEVPQAGAQCADEATS
ncbi:alpha/beta hydrolase [Schaalia suimastitidis]|uniref:alpha/beta hydrolase n=1 Tax=Schaalia suimastitidis TaxID=121163 RepID=UPI000685ABC1|nr:alpha/beta hydrolase [Schaalia suimastitidis]